MLKNILMNIDAEDIFRWWMISIFKLYVILKSIISQSNVWVSVFLNTSFSSLLSIFIISMLCDASEELNVMSISRSFRNDLILKLLNVVHDHSK
jgi:hypothetical protein